jgi:uncharacterized phiE125 gp8 family phage protein
MNLSRTSAPATEPVTLAEAKAHLGVTISDDDARIQALITAAREWAESYTRRSFISQTWAAKFDAFPLTDSIRLPGPLLSITSVGYMDADGEARTFTDYSLDAAGERILLDYAADWPDTRDIENAVTITFIVGYAAVPESIKAAIKLKVESLYDRPDAAYGMALNSAIMPILSPYRDERRL